MSLVTHDLRCIGPEATEAWSKDRQVLDGHFACSVLYKHADGPPPCPCGAPRIVFFATLAMQGQEIRHKDSAQVGVFRPFDVGDKHIGSPAELLAYRQEIARDHNVPLEAVQVANGGNRREKLDEIKHNTYMQKRRAGFDTEAQWQRHTQDQERLHHARHQTRR